MPCKKMLKKGFPVFLWNKLFDKLLEKNKNKYDAKKKLNDILDLNDLVRIYRIIYRFKYSFY